VRDLPRWLNILLTVLALAALNFLGRGYGQWGLGVVAGVAVFVLGNLAYRFASGTRISRRKPIPEHEVLVYIDGTGLPAEVYRDNDLDTIERELERIIETRHLGEFDGNAVGETGATLFMYGPDGERLFAGVEAALRAYPLCKNARVVIRPGPPGTPSREVRL